MSIVFSSIFIVTSIVAVGCAVYIKLKRQYTRERYAFVALTATIGLVFLAVTSIVSDPPWTIVAALLAHFLDDPSLLLPESNWAEKILIVGIVFFAIWLLHRTFIQWDGPISVRQHSMSRMHDSSTIINDGIVEVLRILHNKPAHDVYLPDEPTGIQLELETPSYTRTWRDDARELVELRCQQYVFDPDNGWHEKQSCWLGSDMKTNYNVALMCCQKTPSETEISQFIDYVCALPSVSADNIEFIVAARTAEPEVASVAGLNIRIEGEESLLNGLVDFTDYIVDIRRRVEKESLPDSELTVEKVYVPSRILSSDNVELSDSLEDYLINWLKEAGQRHLAVLGEYGQGKSTGTLMFAYHLLTEPSTASIPLYLELRGKSPSTLQPVELLGAWASSYRIDPRALLKLLIKGRVFLILEGFDEMAGVTDRDARINHFRALWRFAYPNSKLLFTGRPNFFLDDTELKAALGIASACGSGPYCEHVRLLPFGRSQIRESLRWATNSIRDEILELSEKDGNFYDIVSRPSLLYIVGRLWRSPDFTPISEVVDAAQVMGAFVQHCYRRQTEKHRGFQEFMVLTEGERIFFMDGVVALMATDRMPNQITQLQFNRAISKLYEVIPETIPFEASLPGPFDGPLKKRMVDRDDAVEAVQTDVRTYGLLVRDYSRPGTFKFPHKSFFEYLLGALVAEDLLGKRPEYIAAIRSAVELDPGNVVDVPESLLFLGKILARSLPSQDHRTRTLNSLFDTIVMPRKFKTPEFCRVMYLRLLVSRYMFGYFRTSLLLLLLLLSLSLLLLLLLQIFLEDGPTVHISFSVMIATIFYHVVFIEGKRKQRNIALWYFVTKSLGISHDDLVRAYGKRTINAISRTVYREIPLEKKGHP